jgi:FkbM family methyltransferase
MPSPRHIRTQLRRARLLRPGRRFLVREVVVRAPVTHQYRLRRTGQLVTLRHRTQDLGSLDEVHVLGTYDAPAPVEAVLAAIRRPLQVVDLGANIGLFGLRTFARFPDARVTAFEPDPANADVMRRTVAANGLTDRWEIVEACAGTADGTVRFRTGDFMGSQIDEAGVPTPIRDVFPLLRGADLVKIDIEGAEAELLEDERFVALDVPVLALEYHPPLTEAAVRARLDAAGYVVHDLRTKGPYGELWATKRR